MHINLTDPDAVWAAANPILTQPNAVAIFAKALALLPPSTDDTRNALHRIRLQMCHGLALFSAGQIDASLAVLRTALGQAACQPMPAPQPQATPPFDPQSALAALRSMLVALAAHDCQAFASGGALLGLVREGQLLPHDKDLDVVLPVAQLQMGTEALTTMGWKPAWTAVKAVNFRSFVHASQPLTLDLFGYELDPASQRIIGGWWPVGLPREQGRLLAFTPFELSLRYHPWGRHWEVSEPEALLAQLYGPSWRTPDVSFDATLETPALLDYNTYTRTWGALRLLEAWVQGRPVLVTRRLQALARRDAADPTIQAFAAPGARALPC